MKRLTCLLVFLLLFFLIAYANGNRATPPEPGVSPEQIRATLDDLEARSAALQAKIRLSEAMLKKYDVE